jgi:hypothetical protein
MSNRHQRRRDLRAIRRSDLITHLIAAEVPLDDHGLLHRAVLHWYGTLAERRPVCIVCKASFLDDATRVGAFLLALSISAPSTVVTSAFCLTCHETLTAAEVDAVCTRLLRQVTPKGRFMP